MKDGFIKVAACTPEIKVADIDFNVKSIIAQIHECKNKEVKIAVFPRALLNRIYLSGSVFSGYSS